MSAPSAVDSLCVFAPVLPERAGDLDQALRALPQGPESFLASLPGTHMARFVVVPHLRRNDGRPLDDTAYLLFGSEFDGPLDDYLAAFAAAKEAHTIFGHCAGHRADGTPESLLRYLKEYLLLPGYSTVAYPDVLLADVLHSLRLRDRLSAFALDAQGLEPAALKQAWVDSFGGTG